jgi:release factor glutamine methyltransferase
VIDIINWGKEYFKNRGLDDGRLTIELMLCHVLNCSKVDLYTDFDKPLSKVELEQLKVLIKRRLRREPLQYIVGKAEFMGLEFKVTPDVLIPRPETEVLVERAIEDIKNLEGNISVLDIGTGSGNIAISIAKILGDKVSIVGVDISERAIQVASENAVRLKVDNVRFICDDLFDENFVKKFKSQFDVIISNPPYVSISEFSKLQDEIKRFEPLIAVTDGGDGLKFFKRIAKIGGDLLKNSGLIFLEMSYNQSEKVRRIFEVEGYRTIQFFKDYLGIDRVIKIKKGR